MTSRATGTAERVQASADFFTDLQRQLRAASDERELHAAAEALDGADFDKLPPGAREDLSALYADRLFHITGALHG